jgi:hypothetical protein
LNGNPATCSELAGFCSYSFVASACPVQCGDCPETPAATTTAPGPGSTAAPTTTTTTTTKVACTDQQTTSNCEYWANIGYCVHSYVAYMESNCCYTCSKTTGSTPSPPPPATNSECVQAESLAATCTPCRESRQCAGYSAGEAFCCPFLKKCVASSSQSCSYPIANCNPVCHSADCSTCTPSDGSDYASWGNPTC